MAYFSLHLFTVNQRFDISHEQSDFFYRNVTKNICFCLDIEPHKKKKIKPFFINSFNPEPVHIYFLWQKKNRSLGDPTDPFIRGGGLWSPKEMPSFEPQQGKEVIQVNEDCLEKLEPLGWGKSVLSVFFWKVESWVISEKKGFPFVTCSKRIGSQ